MSDLPPVKRTGKKKHPNVAAAERRLETDKTVVSLFGSRQVIPEHPMDPEQVRPVNPGRGKGRQGLVRMGKRMTELHERVKRGEITMADFVATMDPEELARGQLKAKDGTFRGAPPKWVPAEFHNACMKELLKRGETIWKETYVSAIEAFSSIAKDESLPAKDRLKAAQYVIERIAGKVPDRVEVAASSPWETLISGIVAEAEDDAIARASVLLGNTEG